MHKTLLAIYLLTSTTLALSSNDTPNIIHKNNISVLVFSEYKIQVYKDKEHMFGIDCDKSKATLCGVLVTNDMDNKYKVYDGIVEPNNEVLKLSVENVQSIINKKQDLVFILSTGNATGSFANIKKFTINTDTGSFYKVTTEYDWLRYGHPLDYPLGD